MQSNQTESRTDLFLLRLWTDEADRPGVEDGSTGTEIAARRHGRVLDMLSGESHGFDDWQGLIGILQGMVAHAEEQTQS
jgi:hypothetical protein